MQLARHIVETEQQCTEVMMKDKAKDKNQLEPSVPEQQTSDSKKPAYKEPKLTLHGDITEHTAFTGSGSI